jgi:hypothetical protein
MNRILLIHWHAGEAEERAGRLRRLGHEVATFSSQEGGEALRGLLDRPPDAFVIDLGRLPSHGREVAGFFRRQKATRRVPLVFVGGAPEKVERARRLLPDAVYTRWKGIAVALRRAMAEPPARPVVPGAMAGYSGTPLPKKLGIKPGARVALVDAPDDFEATLGDLPEGVRLRRGARGPTDVVLLFARSRACLARRFPQAARALSDPGALWLVWPKKASGVATDLTQQDVRAHGLGLGFVDYKICAIDEVWSGLCFSRRR